MIIKCFSLLDIKTGMFNTPFFMAHTGQAIRACMDLGQDMSTTVGRHPADFILVELGTFDDQAGVLHHITPLQLGTVASFLPVRPQQPGLFQLGMEAGPGASANTLPNGQYADQAEPS